MAIISSAQAKNDVVVVVLGGGTYAFVHPLELRLEEEFFLIPRGSTCTYGARTSARMSRSKSMKR